MLLSAIIFYIHSFNRINGWFHGYDNDWVSRVNIVASKEKTHALAEMQYC